VVLIDLAAGLANLEGDDPRVDLSMFRMTAGDEGIHALKAVDAFRLQQLFESAVNLKRCLEAVIAQTVEDGIGAERMTG